MKRIFELARDHSAKVSLVYIPGWLRGPLDAKTMQAFEDMLNMPCYFPPRSLLEGLYASGNWVDGGHMSPEGRLVFSNWLATELLNEK